MFLTFSQKNLMWQIVFDGWKSNVSIWHKFKLITVNHIWFVVKLLWKCYDITLFLFLLNSNFCDSQVIVVKIG